MRWDEEEARRESERGMLSAEEAMDYGEVKEAKLQRDKTSVGKTLQDGLS